MNTSEHQDANEAEYQPLLTSEGPNKPVTGVEGSSKSAEDDAQEGSKSKKDVKYLLGMAVKKETTYWNLVVMPLLPFITCTINFYATAFMPLLLESKDYFSIPSSDLGKMTATVVIWSQILPLIMTPFLTYVYETVGRRIPVTYALLSTNLLVWLMPKVAPNFTYLCILRSIIGLNNTLIMGAPLISDYVKAESRGRAVAINTLAIGISQLFATQFLVPVTFHMTYEQSFGVSALMMMTLSLPAIFMIREPSPKMQGPAAEAQGSSSQIIRQVTSQLFNRVCFDPKWLFLFIGVSQAHLIAYLYGSYLVLWLNSFVATGQIETNKDVEMIFSRMTLVAMPSTILTIISSGYLADIAKPVYLIAPAFFCRSLVTYFFKNIEDPTSPFAYTLTALLLATSTVQVVSLESVFMKNLTRDVRGAMTILMTVFLEIAALLFNFAGGPIFDSLGPASPFTLVAVFDMALFAFALVLGYSGHLNTQVSNQEEEQDKDKQQKNDEVSSGVEIASLEQHVGH